MVAHMCNSNAWEAEKKRITVTVTFGTNLSYALSISQPGLQNLYVQKKKKRVNKLYKKITEKDGELLSTKRVLVCLKKKNQRKIPSINL